MDLKEIEARLQSLIEVQLAGALMGINMENLVVQKLAQAIKDNTISRPDGTRLAPSIYTLIVAPGAMPQWQDAHLLETLVEIIKTTGREAGLKFEAAPIITVTTDASFSADHINLLASHQVNLPMENTQNTSANPDENVVEDNTMPENAFLIIEGVKVFPLRAPVINIGRRLDNTLVIDDPRVSRNHAQLRAIKGRYVIFDLNSTGGTFINGQRTSQSVLYPGDVVSLAGVALIFGQDNPPPRPDLAETSPFDSPSADRPTAVIRTSPLDKKKE
ncbi:MAG TPA: FHA domain-containing protein [Anaerolineales bacterium]|nr:FHA domain-containing protein [Anaerolineales bacterium]